MKKSLILPLILSVMTLLAFTGVQASGPDVYDEIAVAQHDMADVVAAPAVTADVYVDGTAVTAYESTPCITCVAEATSHDPVYLDKDRRHYTEAATVNLLKTEPGQSEYDYPLLN